MNSKQLRAIPSVDKVMQQLPATAVARPLVVALVRRELGKWREGTEVPEFSMIVAQIAAALRDLERSKIQPVINGTGILAHTNLGRSPLGKSVAEKLAMVAENYNNLELDLKSGERGGRGAYLEQGLALLCGAEAATLVNNCAAALVLVLRHFTKERKEVVISRGELVQIGGGFRVPEILEASGARLKEVGATNKTTIGDFRQALSGSTGLILKVHQSNFYMSGFVESPGRGELAALAQEKQIAFVEDLGSGAVLRTEAMAGLEHEPTLAEALEQGVEVVCCSGDKLLGGPQAGIIAGKRGAIEALKREPFFRALRCDKLILAAMECTVDTYLAGAGSGRIFPEIQLLKLLETGERELRSRAEALAGEVSGCAGIQVGIVDSKGRMGGGTLPRSEIGSVALELSADGISVEELSARLRRGTPPVIGYISGGKLRIDLRTVFPRQDSVVAAAIRGAMAGERA